MADGIGKDPSILYLIWPIGLPYPPDDSDDLDDSNDSYNPSLGTTPQAPTESPTLRTTK